MSDKSKKCSPIEMRKNLLLVDAFKQAGIDFVAVPVLSDKHKAELLVQVEINLSEIEGDL